MKIHYKTHLVVREGVSFKAFFHSMKAIGVFDTVMDAIRGLDAFEGKEK